MAKKKETQGGADKKAGKQKAKTAKKDQKAPKPMAEKREPRLLKHYRDNVRPALQEQFGFTNPHQIPVIEKVVVNVGIGEAPKNQKLLDSVVEELTIITGQKPVINRSRKSISNFSLREGMPVGVSVTLRKSRMFEFLDRLISAAIPRVRDFRGLPSRSFDGRGNYTMGVKEQIIFPEINYDRVQEVHGMDITVVTSTNKDDEAFALLRQMGFPFRGEDKPVQIGTAA
jgi:large subunit ribosomal protein L5